MKFINFKISPLRRFLLVSMFALEGMLFLLGMVFMLKKGVCNSDELDPIEHCIEHISFFQKLKEIHGNIYLNYIDFFGSFLLVLAVFFLCTYILINLFYSRFLKWQWYKRIFLIEVTGLTLLCFLVTVFFIVFAGESTYRQFETIFGLRLLFFSLFLLILLIFKPIFLVLLSIPYVVSLMFKNIKKSKRFKC